MVRHRCRCSGRAGVSAHPSGLISPASGCSGLLIPLDGGYVIPSAPAQPEGSQNFSTAHEIVHTFFREVRPAAAAERRKRSGCVISALPPSRCP